MRKEKKASSCPRYCLEGNSSGREQCPWITLYDNPEYMQMYENLFGDGWKKHWEADREEQIKDYCTNKFNKCLYLKLEVCAHSRKK
jgi:hypothetical protein